LGTKEFSIVGFVDKVNKKLSKKINRLEAGH